MISKKVAIEVLNEGLKTGADFAEIFYEDSKFKSIGLENTLVDVSTSTSQSGVGIRLLKENRTIYGFTTDLTKKGLLSLASSLASSFNDKQIISVSKLNKIRYKRLSPINRSYESVSDNEIVDLLKKASDAIVEINDPRIVRHNQVFNYQIRHVEVFNSKGKYFDNTNEYGRFMCMVVAADQNGFETGFEGPGRQADFSWFTDTLDVKETAKKAARIALQTLEAVECPSGMMPVIVGNGWGGVLFHESCGHPLEASAISKGLSCFSGKHGEMIASPIVSAVDDSTMPNEWGSIDLDDEGNKGTKRLLIKNGKLNDYMIDDFHGRRMGRNGNGACRRQSYKYCPTSRMSNTYICNGSSSVEEIIANTKLGLYTKSFNGGSVDPSTGEFNFGCSEAYIIRDGKIAEPVKGASLIGKGNEILKNIDMIADDLELAQGMCGAASGSIRTNVGQPTLRISNIMVGGRGGELK